MNQLEYIAKKLSKISHKPLENYIINRIIHKLDDLSINFILQQVVKNHENRYMIDLYFPQFRIAVEIDEPYHLKQIEKDKLRERNIVQNYNIKFVRIDCTQSQESIHEQIDELIETLKTLKEKPEFIPYNYEKEFNPNVWVEKGFINTHDDVKVRTHKDALLIMRELHRNTQMATVPLNETTSVWFPKLYENKDWDNKLSSDGQTITMKPKTTLLKKPKVIHKKIIVFAHQKDELNQTYYRFEGVFTMTSLHPKEAIYQKISDHYNLTTNSCLEIE